MAKNQTKHEFNPVRALQKFAVSAFVVCSFLAYVVHEHVASQDSTVSALAPTTSAPATEPLQDTPVPSDTPPQPAQAAAPTAAPSTAASATTAPRSAPTPTSAARPKGAYKDGTFTGSSVNAFWGQVQVKVVVQNGKITDVQFLQYPSDRRTSVRINTTVMPWLKSEAIQAQNANVDIISGATLTSEAFMQSLQAALSTAKS